MNDRTPRDPPETVAHLVETGDGTGVMMVDKEVQGSAWIWSTLYLPREETL